MKVDKELIEKYHRQECTPAEAHAVEEWLFDDTSDEELQLPPTQPLVQLKQQMWDDISTIFPNEKPAESAKSYVFNRAFWTGAIAASTILVIAAVGFYLFNRNSKQEPILVSINNQSSVDVKQIRSVGYDMSVGPNTSAHISSKNKVVNFTGSIILQPKEDIELSFDNAQQKVVFKAGQTYILFNDAKGRGKVLIVNERNLMDIPPVLQKKISTQFKI